MILDELPRLKQALGLMGLDIGANAVGKATIPADWEMRARLAEDELIGLSPDSLHDLTQGEETDMNAAGELAPNAMAILDASFDDGELAETFFDPWLNIFDARAAENRLG